MYVCMYACMCVRLYIDPDPKLQTRNEPSVFPSVPVCCAVVADVSLSVVEVSIACVVEAFLNFIFGLVELTAPAEAKMHTVSNSCLGLEAQMRLFVRTVSCPCSHWTWL